MRYKVCIQAAGVGSRLTIGKGLHKALIPINKKSVISRIIDLFPKNTSFIIIVGYQKEQIISFINARYPNLDIKFVEVKKFSGKGSGPGYSLLKAKDHLQEPFIFIACDTIVFRKPPLPTKNWIAVSPTSRTKDYLIIESKSNLITHFYEKKSQSFINSQSKTTKNNSTNTYDAFIGLAGVSDYKLFWQGLYENKTLHKNERQVSSGFNKILENSKKIKVINFKWIDTGSDENYSLAKKYFKDDFLMKTDEFLYNEGDKVIKFFLDESKTNKRYKRKKFLEGVIPNVYKSGKNFMWYEYVKGELLSDTDDKNIFNNFINFLNKNIWSKRINGHAKRKALTKNAMKFYRDKTYNRVKKYIHNNNDADKVTWINGTKITSIYSLLDKIDWHELSQGDFANFHGDPQPENVIVKGKDDFVMIDWREDFGGNLQYGDIYYDLGKIYHSLIVTQKKIREEKYFVSYENDIAQYRFSKRNNLLKYLKYFESFINNNNYDLCRVRLISALIYINIAPLHHHPYSDLLFFHGKLSLHNLLSKK